LNCFITFAVMKLKIFCIFFIFILCCDISIAQNQRTIDSLKTVLFELENEKRKVEVLLKISDILVFNGSEESMEYANKAYLIAKEIDYPRGKAKSLNMVAKIHLGQIKLKLAMEVANRAIEIAELNELLEEKIEAMLVIGFVYNNLGKYDKSSTYFFDCLQLSEEIGDSRLISESLIAIGYSFFEQHNYDKAIEYYIKALSKAREVNFIYGISRCLNSIAAVYGRKNEPDKLISYLLESIEINKSVGNQWSLSKNYSNLAAYYFGNDKPDSSLYYYNLALKTAENSDNTEMISHIKYSKAYQLFLKGKYEESLKIILLVLNFSEQYGLKKKIHSSAVLLDSIYRKTGNYKQAYLYKKMASEIKDSLDLDDKITELSKLELLYDLEKKERIEKTSQQLKEFTYLTGSIILILALGFVLLLLKRSKMKSRITAMQKQKLEDELEVKNKELTTNIISLMKKMKC